LISIRPGEKIVDRFVVRHLAGRGGGGEVFCALDTKSDQLVALKLVTLASDGDGGWFEREVKSLERLRHPRIARYIAHGVVSERASYLAMEWLEGEDLASRLRAGPLNIKEAIELIRDVAEALQYVHDQGIVHRDIKPSNLFLVDKQLTQVKLLDFGLARIRGETGLLTRTGAMVGTVCYMAPEQIRGQRNVGLRSDLYALGSVLFECIAGRVPFDTTHPAAALTRALFDDAPELQHIAPGVPPALNAIVRRLLHKDETQRPQSAREVRDVLDALARGLDKRHVFEQVSPASAPIGVQERRLLCLILVTLDETFAENPFANLDNAKEMNAIVASGRQFSTRFERLGANSFATLVTNVGSQQALAERAANIAYSLRRDVPQASIAVALGRDASGNLQSIGEVVERAASLLSGAGEIVLDAACARLLESRFEIRHIDSRFVLECPAAIGNGPEFAQHALPFIGRDRESSMLDDFFATTSSESRGGVMLVTGEAGTGKTRLRDEFVRRLRHRGTPTEIWVAVADSMSAGSALAMFSSGIRRTLSILDHESADVGRRKIQVYAEQFLSGDDSVRVTRFLGQLVGLPFPDDDERLAAARHDPVLMGNQLRQAVTDLFAAICERRPLLLLLDDLHWGDVATVKLVDSVLRQLDTHPLGVLALARPEVDELIRLRWKDCHVERLQLSPLRTKACEQLVRGALGPDLVKESNVRHIVERAGGNAFFLEELIRAERKGQTQRFPDTVLAMAQLRLERLDVGARRILRGASVFGTSFHIDAVAALLDISPPAVEMALEELYDEQVLVHRRAHMDEKIATFRHAFLRDAAYEMLTPEDRVAGHFRAAEWLEQSGHADALAIAQHFERGHANARAIPFWIRVVDEAIAGSDYDGAVTHAHHALARTNSPESAGMLHLRLATAHAWSGGMAEASMHAQQALHLLPVASTSWYAAAERLRWAAMELVDRDRLSWLREQLMAAEDRAVPSVERAVAWISFAECGFFASNLEIGNEDLARAQEIAAACEPNPSAEARMYCAFTVRSLILNRPGDALEACMKAVELLRRIGDAPSVFLHTMNVGVLCTSLGAYEDAKWHLGEALITSRRLGIAGQRLWVEHSLGRVLALTDRFDEGVAQMRQALVALREAQFNRFWAVGSSELSFVLVNAHHFDSALEVLAPVLETEAPDNAKILAHVARARVSLGQGNSELALEHARAAHDLQETSGDREHCVSVLFTLAVALDATSAHDEARETCRKAFEVVMMTADTLRDLEQRRVFLEKVAEHVRVLELARSWKLGETS
jgi:eukaryotic-like serine/threonine-protein kinase